LDPRINLHGLLADYDDEPDLQADIKRCKAKLEQYYQEHFAIKVQVAQNVQAKPASSAVDDFNFTNRYARRPSANRDETAEYFKLPSEDWETTDPIQWWAARKAQFPNLSCLARRILCIPGMYTH
jgi:hypothetical protein